VPIRLQAECRCGHGSRKCDRCRRGHGRIPLQCALVLFCALPAPPRASPRPQSATQATRFAGAPSWGVLVWRQRGECTFTPPIPPSRPLLLDSDLHSPRPPGLINPSLPQTLPASTSSASSRASPLTSPLALPSTFLTYADCRKLLCLSPAHLSVSAFRHGEIPLQT
jgi:hypothetical protein